MALEKKTKAAAIAGVVVAIVAALVAFGIDVPDWLMSFAGSGGE